MTRKTEKNEWLVVVGNYKKVAFYHEKVWNKFSDDNVYPVYGDLHGTLNYQ